jgi:hypothetical protein
MDGVGIALEGMAVGSITGVMAEGFMAAAVDAPLLPGVVARLVLDVSAVGRRMWPVVVGV